MKKLLQVLKDPGSALTHFIGMTGAVIAAVPLLVKAARESGPYRVVALAVFIVSMILLYAASTVYHTFDISVRANRILRKLSEDGTLERVRDGKFWAYRLKEKA